MGGFTGLGIVAEAVAMQDRDTGKSYAVHSHGCHGAFTDFLFENGIAHRFVEMGPAVLDGDRCNWSACSQMEA